MDYVIVTQPSHKNRHYIARKMIGGSYLIVATCTGEETARKICDAMNFENPVDRDIRQTKARAPRIVGSAEVTRKSKAA
jgi:hypothetical protein